MVDVSVLPLSVSFFSPSPSPPPLFAPATQATNCDSTEHTKREKKEVLEKKKLTHSFVLSLQLLQPKKTFIISGTL